MEKVVTSLAKAYQIIAVKCKLGIVVIVLDVMHGSRFSLPAVSLAPLTLVLVAAQYRRTLAFPLWALIEFTHKLELQFRPELARPSCRLKLWEVCS